MSLLRRAGARVVPWGRLVESRFDAAITASENTELQSIHPATPILVLQHGVGFHKRLSNTRGEGYRLAGAVRSADLHSRRVSIAVTHPQQAEQLAAVEPEAAKRCVLVADPVLGRLRASRLMRDRYRTAFGLDGRRLVVVSSTWGRHSLLGRWPRLPARLLAQLDAEEYRVATILHPNVTAAHGALQVRLWLAAARDAGLLMVPPETGWQSTLATADCVVGDHSSVSLLAAGAGIPLLLAPLAAEVVPGTPMTALARLARRLDVRSPLAEQVKATISDDVSGRYDEAVTATFAETPAVRPLRSVLYDLIGLAEPDEPTPLTLWPAPAPDRVAVGSFVVHSRVHGEVIETRRFPAAVRHEVANLAPGWVGHLSAGSLEWDLRMLQGAAVLTRAAATEDTAAWDWTLSTIKQFCGSDLACAGTASGCVATFRDGRRVALTAKPEPDPGAGAGAASVVDITALAAGLYTLADQRLLSDGQWRIRTARGTRAVTIRLLPGS